MREITLAIPQNGDSIMGLSAPLEDLSTTTIDITGNPTSLPMGFLTSNEYLLKRVVGKIYVSVSQIAGTQKGAILCAAGLFVARAENPAGDPGAEDFPIGARDVGVFADYAPLNTDTMREPWIWRRSWVLSNQLSTLAAEIISYPKTNVEYGSVADGPHIDAKTARRVKEGERLFFAVQARAFPVNHTTAGDSGDVTVHFAYEVRALGALRKGHNRSAF